MTPADPALRRVRSVIERLLRDGTAVARSDGSVHELFPIAITEAEGMALRRWVEHEHAGRTIAIGLGYGVSALFIGEGLLAGGSHGPRHQVPHGTEAGTVPSFEDSGGLSFIDRSELVAAVERDVDLVLCGAKAPACAPAPEG